MSDPTAGDPGSTNPPENEPGRQSGIEIEPIDVSRQFVFVSAQGGVSTHECASSQGCVSAKEPGRDADLLLLDCREPDEHAIARIEGARLIPMREIPERISELEPWRGRPIIVHCHHGVRSMRVVRWLRDRGFTQARSMRGGIEAWSLEVDPAVPRY